MYIQSVSTRKVEPIIEKLVGHDISSSSVSKATTELDETLQAWRNRPLNAQPTPYLILEVRYEKDTKKAESYIGGYRKIVFFARNFFTLRQNVVELVLWGGYSFIIIGKAGNGANYTARSIKCYAFDLNVSHNIGCLNSSNVFL